MSCEIIRNQNTYPGMLPGMKILSREITTDGSQRVYTVETGCPYIHFAMGFKYLTSDGSLPLVVSGIVSSSTKYVGTKKVAFTIIANTTCQILIIGSTEKAGTVAVTADTSEDGFELMRI